MLVITYTITYYDVLRRDNLPAVDVKTWYLHGHMFDGDIAAGPVPLLFAANPDEAAASIAAEPAKAHFDLSKVTFIHTIHLVHSLIIYLITHKDLHTKVLIQT